MKKKRHQEILGIIKENDIENQEMLIAELRKRGIAVTQATISRDMAQLGLGKAVSEDGAYRYVIPEKLKTVKFEGLFSQAVKLIDRAMNTVVVKTYPGMATAVCAALDMRDIRSIAGTIAGDDTIFVLTRSEKEAVDLTTHLRKLI